MRKREVNGESSFPTDVSHEHELIERVKELDCLFKVAQIFSVDSLTLEDMLERITEVIPRAFQRPERICAAIRLDSFQALSSNFVQTDVKITCSLSTDDRIYGSVEVGYLPEDDGLKEDPFLEHERMLTKAVCSFIGNRIVQKRTESDLRKATLELERQKDQLEQKNIALRQILEQIEIEKQEMKEEFVANIEQLILPVVRKLNDQNISGTRRAVYMESLERNLKGLASRNIRRITSDRARLSPRETEIAVMIREGLSSKEIAEQLGVSELTIERHRHNIRRKFGIASEKINLYTFLQQL